MQPNSTRKIKTGFTLIELLVVIAIVGILAGMVVVNMSGATDKARIAKGITFAASIQRSMGLNCLGEWTFNDQTAQDTSGQGNNGTVSGGASYSTDTSSGIGLAGQYSISFDGTNGWMDTGKTYDSIGLSSEYTVSAWVKFNNETASWMGVAGDWGGGEHIHFGRHSTKVFSNHINVNSVQYDAIGTTPIKSGVWYYIVSTAKLGDSMNIYVDGSLERYTALPSGTLSVSTGNLAIGRPYSSVNSFPLNGSIDDVRIYNQAATISQIRENYLAGLEKLLVAGQISAQEYQQRSSELNLSYAISK
ncbi:MAG: LamG-like jellyroll fold domain-containing protein [Candidatus Paceibacterota bacterium]|jgi:prepilin-type N-terminal cleavage/methylation domain-containing protein